MPIKLHGYPQPDTCDELLDAALQPRPAARVLFDYVNRLGTEIGRAHV